MNIKCYKGAKNSDIITIDVEASTKLKDIRDKLVNKKFIPSKDAEDLAYRFVFKEMEVQKDENDQELPLLFDDAIVSKRTEITTCVSEIWGYDKQIVLTNVAAPKSPDLVGFCCDSWINGYLSVSCKLNQRDPEAIKHNNSIGAFQPMMLYNVLCTNKYKKEGGPVNYYNYVCVCMEESMVRFHLSSWGAAGYEYAIEIQDMPPVVSGLYHTFGDTPNRYGATSIGRWQEKEQTIAIRGIKNDSSIANKVSYQRVTVKTRNLISYKRDGKLYRSDATPPVLMPETSFPILLKGNFIQRDVLIENLKNAAVDEIVILSGDSITPGTPVPGVKSIENFYTINDTITTPWEEPLGVVVIHFFVFTSKEEALNTIQGLNSLDYDL